ncbi:MAG: cation:proton antiporter [Candidatus Melainabacteria bacterium]|nr:cation:proton antiporter [Candidatus Melainabacteria bacterium]
MEFTLLKDVVTILILSLFVILICHRIRIPAIVGFLLTGVIAGPHGLGLINAINQVELLAEIGIVLLLFTIGIEFSLQNLFKVKRAVFLGGPIQVVFTILLAFSIAAWFKMPPQESIFIGFLISLSSTAIVMKLLQERAEINSPHGLVTLGILIFQDIIVVPMMLFVPILAGVTDNIGKSIIIDAFIGIAIISLVVLSAKWLVPQILYQVAQTKNRELFLLTVIAICIIVAWLTSNVGLSLALGAFLAGLIISESEYSHQALSNILPFRDIFISFFFVSVGMLLDVNFCLNHMTQVLIITVSVIILKTIIAASSCASLGFPFRTNMLVGLSLSQVGEFSFVLFKTGADHGLLNGDIYQYFLGVSILTMATTPLIIQISHPTVDKLTLLPMPKWFKSGLYRAEEIKSRVGKKDHIIIIGFGVTGKHLAHIATINQIPYVIIEINPRTVIQEKAKGESIYYGDAIHETVIEYADAKDAKLIVIGVSDPNATSKIIQTIRRINSTVHIIARTRFEHEADKLYELGASEVIIEEIETSVEIFNRAMHIYTLPKDKIKEYISNIRVEHSQSNEE